MHAIVTANAAWNIWNFRQPVLRAIAESGGRTIVLAPPDDSFPRLQALGCITIPMPMDVKGLNPVVNLRQITEFRRHFEALKPDIVLSFTIKNNIFGAFAAKSMDVPFIPNVTGLGTAFLAGRALRAASVQLYRSAFRNLPTVFFENGEDRDLFDQLRITRGGQAVALPGTGLDLKHFAGAEFPPLGSGIVFLMVGRILRDKGVIEYVEAARALKRARPDLRFQLLGPLDAQNRSAISVGTVRDWQAEGVIEYLGATDDVRPFVRAAHCVVLPSYREGAPRGLMEAAAMARPIVTTDVVGCRAVVDRDVTGFLCAPRSADALAAAMARFLRLGPDRQRLMGLAGQQKMINEYDERLVIDAYHAAIHQALDHRHPAPL